MAAAIATAVSKAKDTLQVPHGDNAGAGSASSGGPSGAASGERRRSGLFPFAKSGHTDGNANNNHRNSETVGLMGVLASKRVAGKLANKVYERRRTIARDSTSNGMQATVKLEPTYRLEPKAKIPESSVHGILKAVLHENLDKYTYKPRTAAIVCRKMTEEIQEQTKGLSVPRYKLVTTVLLGEIKQQSMMVSSRCAWDEKFDNYSTYTFSNGAIFCTATVYFVYAE